MYSFYLDSSNKHVLDTTEFRQFVDMSNQERAAAGRPPLDAFGEKMRVEFCLDIHEFIKFMLRMLAENYTIQSYMISREFQTIIDNWNEHVNPAILESITV